VWVHRPGAAAFMCVCVKTKEGGKEGLKGRTDGGREGRREGGRERESVSCVSHVACVAWTCL
jgi:hypothetical protein